MDLDDPRRLRYISDAQHTDDEKYVLADIPIVFDRNLQTISTIYES